MEEEKQERIQELRLNLVFGVEGCKDITEAQEQLEKSFCRENRTASNEFWENMELVEIVD